MNNTSKLGVRGTSEKFTRFMTISLHRFKDVISNWLQSSPSDVDHSYREDCLADSVLAQDLYPREEIHSRIKDHAAEHNAMLLDARDIDADDLKVRWCMFEDGVLHYKVTHDQLPVIEYDHLTNTGPNTDVVETHD